MDKYFIQPGRQVCIVPIYLTTIYERCQLIDLELKMINNDILWKKRKKLVPLHNVQIGQNDSPV